VALILLTLLYTQAPLFAQQTPQLNSTTETIETGRDNGVDGGGGFVSQGYASTAHAFIESMAKGEFEKSMSFLDGTMRSALSPDKLKSIWQQLNASGTNKEPRNKRLFTEWQESQNGHTSVFIPSQFGDTILNLVVVFSGSDKVAGFFVRPHLDEAPYVKLDEFKEHEVHTPIEDAIVKQAEYLASQSSGEDETKMLNAPELNHFFMAGIGKSTGKEYFESPGHVDKRVIDDIAEWIQKQQDLRQ
jgi:hypothetical protein